MNFLDYFKKNESALFRFWNTLSSAQRQILKNQLESININTLENQRLLLTSHQTEQFSFEPFNDFIFSGHSDYIEKGKELIMQGKAGCLLLAGGQGTRLQYAKAKGTYPISVIHHKSLFQLCAEKVVAASKWAKRLLNLTIMTSPENHEEIVSFFNAHRLFGLDPTQLSFFIQNTLPLLDSEGKLFLKSPYEIASGPDGNGNSLMTFSNSGILKNWKEQGVKWMNVILIDNPLADPFDVELIGYHAAQNHDITIKCTEKKEADEKVGVLVKQKGRTKVIEYSEMPKEEKEARRNQESLKHCCANLSLFCFSLSFIERLSSINVKLPLHKAWKGSQFMNDEGKSTVSSQPIAWKFETFIFDWLEFAEKSGALLYPREECFAPLKNLTGHDSPQTVRMALQEKDRKVYQSITGLQAPSFPFELPADFYYITEEFKLKWKGKEWVS